MNPRRLPPKITLASVTAKPVSTTAKAGSTLPLQETNGAIPSPKTASNPPTSQSNSSLDVKSIVARTVEGSSTKSNTSLHQTHGAITPMNGPITNVNQLTGRSSVAKGSAGSFAVLKDYTAHLRTLSNADLHRHAIEDAHIVPIDDRERLIRRLEGEWTTVAGRLPAHRAAINAANPTFSAEQMAVQDEIYRKLTHR